MITAYRIVKAEFAEDAFSGEGSVLYAGRWHSAGTRIVYTAETVALATLEILVHMRRRVLPEYMIIACSFPETLVDDVRDLPPDWFTCPAPVELQRIGDEWVQSRRSAVLRVPSAVTRVESNYLLSPEHEDFHSVHIGPPRPFTLDMRLVI